MNSARKHEFKIISIGWVESDPTTVMAYDEIDACDEWCLLQDRASGFVDGYPDAHELKVIDQNGVESRWLVSADWQPRFVIEPKSRTAP